MIGAYEEGCFLRSGRHSASLQSGRDTRLLCPERQVATEEHLPVHEGVVECAVPICAQCIFPVAVQRCLIPSLPGDAP